MRNIILIYIFMMSFKIISGKHFDITYINDDVYSFEFKDFDKNDLFWIYGDYEEADSAYCLNKLSGLNNIKCVFTGRSKLDNSPIFVIEEDILRDCKIDFIID